jgi:hypothetical protein
MTEIRAVVAGRVTGRRHGATDFRLKRSRRVAGMTLAPAFRKRYDGHGTASVTGRFGPDSAAFEHRFRAFGQRRSGLSGIAFAIFCLRMPPFKWPMSAAANGAGFWQFGRFFAANAANRVIEPSLNPRLPVPGEPDSPAKGFPCYSALSTPGIMIYAPLQCRHWPNT